MGKTSRCCGHITSQVREVRVSTVCDVIGCEVCVRVEKLRPATRRTQRPNTFFLVSQTCSCLSGSQKITREAHSKKPREPTRSRASCWLRANRVAVTSDDCGVEGSPKFDTFRDTLAMHYRKCLHSRVERKNVEEGKEPRIKVIEGRSKFL